MFFGRKPEPEKTTITSLTPLLNSLFNKKLEKFESSAFGITKELNTLKTGFIDACNSFEELKVEPYTEDMWNPNVNSIKTQKTAYSAALRNVVGKLSVDMDSAPNVYAKYKLVFLNVEDTTNSILRYNSTYKVVLYCYSNHLREFKRSFSAIERIRDMLKGELDKKISDYDTCNAIGEKISKLKIGYDEIETLKGNIEIVEASLNSGNDDEIQKREKEIEEKISSCRLELSKAKSQITELTNKINLLTAPLERAAKKFDHTLASKKHLNSFIEDPIATIYNQNEYKEFVEMLNQLKESVESGHVEVKNKSDIISAISRLIQSEIYYDIDSLNPLKLRISDLEGEIRELERILDSIRSVREDQSKAIQKMDEMKIEIKNIGESQELLKAAIERSFLDSYSKPIKIVIEGSV